MAGISCPRLGDLSRIHKAIIMFRIHHLATLSAKVSIAALTLAGCDRKRPPLPQRRLSPSARRMVTESHLGAGTISPGASKPWTPSRFVPRVNGYVERVAFRDGDYVKKGDLFFRD